jgi:hypothetical protein
MTRVPGDAQPVIGGAPVLENPQPDRAELDRLTAGRHDHGNLSHRSAPS